MRSSALPSGGSAPWFQIGEQARLGVSGRRGIGNRDLGQDLSVVQHESRNVALGVDLPIIAAVGGLLVGDVNPLEIEGVSGFASHDVRGHGAGAGGVVELHVQFLSGAVDWANSRS